MEVEPTASTDVPVADEEQGHALAFPPDMPVGAPLSAAIEALALVAPGVEALALDDCVAEGSAAIEALALAAWGAEALPLDDCVAAEEFMFCRILAVSPASPSGPVSSLGRYCLLVIGLAKGVVDRTLPEQLVEPLVAILLREETASGLPLNQMTWSKACWIQLRSWFSLACHHCTSFTESVLLWNLGASSLGA